jgi:hypothetical protein
VQTPREQLTINSRTDWRKVEDKAIIFKPEVIGLFHRTHCDQWTVSCACGCYSNRTVMSFDSIDDDFQTPPQRRKLQQTSLNQFFQNTAKPTPQRSRTTTTARKNKNVIIVRMFHILGLAESLGHL